ncbi:class I SAM-dependent methyltransferase [Microbacterium sp. M3]|uniref:Class I SAM-dependent methyltransferase n=1 Tax=Microbacterium arthrosphaerae TaxID=792652 RepID=A0ABU4GWH3_9MICO|nr:MULTISPECIES: class I SAM-dependent methyltransferase [Microbacterium]MDW4571423.1 class I SAM-dependent methyltransferase [Microbacterium arthrosphaerae]MDW7605278.1 class I SAM-dependent methyltransferase [Microbacterium sp. M3]
MADASMWDAEAQTFDDAVDHGLRHPSARAAWRALLVEVLGHEPLRVADLGCGTGTLSVLLAAEGHEVTGVDFSPAMIERARAKAGAAQVAATLVCADASAPPLTRGGFDVVLSRHVLWAMPDPPVALGAWIDLLRPGGLLVLIEGRWHTGAGLTAEAAMQLVDGHRLFGTDVRRLPDPELWGGEITDERYVLTARRAD